jgi:(E)-4-hydroxy-3-methylbut-2-enyl-diphosphate synthase
VSEKLVPCVSLCSIIQQILRIVLAADRRAQFEKLEYTDDDYQQELEHIEKVENKPLFCSVFSQCETFQGNLTCRIISPPFQVFSPLVEKCKQYGRAMRIGTNHGSLSDRIMSYYGDSPRGMVIISFLMI